MIKTSRLRLFGHVEHIDDNDWVKRCMTLEVEEIRQRGDPEKTWWDCVKLLLAASSARPKYNLYLEESKKKAEAEQSDKKRKAMSDQT